MLRYEDAACPPDQYVDHIARYLRLSLTRDEVSKIAATVTPERIKATIDDYIVAGIVDPEKPSSSYHRETHWHPNHIGDGAVGKYKHGLTQNEAAFVFERTRPFCEVFEYVPSAPARLEPGMTLPLNDGVAPYFAEGFAGFDGHFNWSVGERARMVFPRAAGAGPMILALRLFVSPGLRSGEDNELRVTVNGSDVFKATGKSEISQYIDVAIPIEDAAEQIALDFAFSGIVSPSALELSGDARLIGVAPMSITADTRTAEDDVAVKAPKRRARA